MMEKIVDELETLMRQFADRLPGMTAEELEHWVARREAVINRLRERGVSEAERVRYRERIQAILQWDEKILQRMHDLRREAAQGLRKIGSGKQQRRAYETVFSMDGHFIDKKK